MLPGAHLGLEKSHRFHKFLQCTISTSPTQHAHKGLWVCYVGWIAKKEGFQLKSSTKNSAAFDYLLILLSYINDVEHIFHL